MANLSYCGVVRRADENSWCRQDAIKEIGYTILEEGFPELGYMYEF